MAKLKGSPKTSGSGRKKGTPNKASAKREAEIAKSGKTPLQFLLDRMRNKEAQMADRIECAKAAAMYVHPKPATTLDVGGEIGLKIIERRIVRPKNPNG
jgi:ElaB/YqjD/DUF883 family membrane-anchored ribosome-binding protein